MAGSTEPRRRRPRRRSAVGRRPVEPGHDLGVVGGRAGERRGRQPAAGGRRQPAALAQLGEHRLVVGRVDDDADVGVVLGRRPDHRRAADVDQVDARIAGERVEVDDDERDRRDVVVLEVTAVVGIVRVGEDPAVHLRVERHDAVAEDGGEPRDLGDVGHRDAGLGDGPRRAAAGQQRPAELVETTGEVGDAGLVVHGEQRGGHPRRVTNRDVVGRKSSRIGRSGVPCRRAGRASRAMRRGYGLEGEGDRCVEPTGSGSAIG